MHSIWYVAEVRHEDPTNHGHIAVQKGFLWALVIGPCLNSDRVCSMGSLVLYMVYNWYV